MSATPPPLGEHDQTSALRTLLLSAGVEVAHTGRAPDEALLLGLGGGLGAAVFAFHYQGHLPHLYLETRCHTQYAYHADFLLRAANALGLELSSIESGAAKKAQATLEAAVADGRPCMAFVDILSMPHHAGESPGGALPWVVVVHEVSDENVQYSDRAAARFTATRETFETARNASKKGKNRIVTLTPPERQHVARRTLKAGVRAGIAHCVRELRGQSAKPGFSNNFGLAALEKWADEISATGKKGWRVTFADGPPLAAGLRQIYHWVETAGTGGGAFRALYAEFLRQAADICQDPTYNEVAERYDALAARWRALAFEPLQTSETLREIQTLLDERATLTRHAAPRSEMLAINERLDTLVSTCEPNPAFAAEVYGRLEADVRAVLAAELEAADALAKLA